MQHDRPFSIVGESRRELVSREIRDHDDRVDPERASDARVRETGEEVPALE
jgi:hypothetical protein